MTEIVNKIPLEALTGISATFIAILIPLSLFILESLGSSKSASILSWDNRVIIKQVLQVKILFISLLLTAVPLIFWNIDYLRIGVLALCLLGYLGTIRAMYRAYQWIMSKSTDNYSWIGQLNKDKLTYRNKMRSQYLNSLKSDDEILEVWGTIFQTQGWIGIDSKLFTEKYVQALQQVEKNADHQKEKIENGKNSNFAIYQAEQTLIIFLTSSLDGKYLDSQFNFESLYSFAPLQKFAMQRYTETLDIHDKNFNIRFLIEYLMKYVNSHEFYGFGGNNNMQSSYSFNQDFYDMLRKLQKEDLEKPKDISRVSETLAYYGEREDYGNFGILFFEMVNSQIIEYQSLEQNFGRLNYPSEWKITPTNIEKNTIVQGFWHSFLKYFLEHRKSENSYFDKTRNKHSNSQSENNRLNIISNYFLGISGQKFAEVLELIIFTRGSDIKSSPEEFWRNFIEHPEYEIIDYLNIGNNNYKPVFELLFINFPWFFNSHYLNNYKSELAKISPEKNSKEDIRRRRMLKLLDELFQWQEERNDNE